MTGSSTNLYASHLGFLSLLVVQNQSSGDIKASPSLPYIQWFHTFYQFALCVVFHIFPTTICHNWKLPCLSSNEFNSFKGNHPSSRPSLFQAQLHYTTRTIFPKMSICAISLLKNLQWHSTGHSRPQTTTPFFSHWTSHSLHTVAEINRGKW